MNKKAQVTLMIIIGIVLVTAIAVGYSLYNSALKKPRVERALEIPLEAQPIQNYVDACFRQVAVGGVYVLGIRGGRIYIHDFVRTDFSDINYAFVADKITLPTVAEMESELSSYIQTSISACLNDFASFREQGYDLEIGVVNVSASIGENSVLARMNYPLKIMKGASVTELNNFVLVLPVRLGHDHTVASVIVEGIKKNPDWIDLTQLLSFDVRVDIIPHSSDTLIYAITDNASVVDDKVFLFLFGVKHKKNNPPEILMPDKMNLVDSANANFKLEVFDADNDPLTYSDDTASFDISADGTISFTPEIVGRFNATFTVYDNHNSFDVKTIEFNVIPKNHNPELFAYDIVCAVGNECSGRFYASDVDDDLLFFSTNSPYINLNSGTGAFKFTPATKGVSKIQLSVTDGSYTDTKEVALEVR